jgi:hypothetical protein
MTAPLRLLMTSAGLGRFTAAQVEDDIDLTVATVGLTDAQFVVAPTLTALPGEFHRVATISGQAASDNIVHMIVRDDAPLTYQIRGFGLYLADGTLFAVYGQPDPIGQKSALASLLLAIDIAFPTADVTNLVFGDTNFLNPPATTTTKGVVELATDIEVADGADAERAVTPKSLQARLAALFASRRVNATGLAVGGGNLSGDISIGVPAASADEVAAGVVPDKAVTPAGLSSILAWIATRVPQTRKVLTSGLATGGGTLDGDLTIGVPTATAAEAFAAAIATKALTPASLSSVIAAIGAKVPLTRAIATTGLLTGGRALDGDVTLSVPAATAAETDAGAIGTKAVTPASLVNIISAIVARVPLTRRIDTSGLAIGGNALGNDVTISVPAATAAQLLAGAASDVAATPAALAAAGAIYLVETKSDGPNRYRRFSDGSVEMMGVSTFPGSESAFTLNFPWPFPTACDGIWGTIINSSQTTDGQSTMQEVSLNAASAQLFAQNHKTPTTDAAGGFRWFARGR